MTKKRPFCFFKLIVSLIICVGGGWLTGLFTNAGMKSWYPCLTKSPLTPTNFVFPLVWTILYILMAISLYLVWSAPTKNKTAPLFIFGVQLFLNFIWSFIFFYWHHIGIALVDMTFLWLAILGTILLFFKISKTASYLLIPYLFWVSFAFYLTLFTWNNN